MSMPTLSDLRRMAGDMETLERQAARATQLAEQLRKCGGYKHIGEWLARRSGYGTTDYDGMVKLLEDALIEFSPAILEAIARRQELAAHEAMTAAVMKRAQLGTFVALESAPTQGSAS